MSELSKEIWRPVIYNNIDFSGLYEVSNLGRIATIKNGKRRETKFNKGSHKKPVKLIKGNITINTSVSRLVGCNFIRVPQSYEVIDHINNNPADDRLCNLQIISFSENVSKDCRKRNLPKGVYYYKNPLYPFKSSITRKANDSNKLISISLGVYPDANTAKNIFDIASDEIGFNFKTKDIEKIKNRVKKAVNKYRNEKKLKKM